MSAGLPVVIAAAEQEVDSMFRRLRRWYWWSLGIAIAIHLGLIVGATTTPSSPPSSTSKAA